MMTKVQRDLLNFFVGDWGSLKVVSITPGSSRDTEFSDVHAEIIEKELNDNGIECEVTSCFQVTNNLTGETIICAPIYNVLPSTTGNTIITVSNEYSLRLRFHDKKKDCAYKALVKIGSNILPIMNWEKTDVAMVVNTCLHDIHLAMQFMNSYCQLLANTLGVTICYEFFGVGKCHFIDAPSVDVVPTRGKLKPAEMGRVKLIYDFANYACLQRELLSEDEVEQFIIDNLNVE